MSMLENDSWLYWIAETAMINGDKVKHLRIR